jgi:hypothetical protein
MKRILFVSGFVLFYLKCFCISNAILTADSLSEKRAFGTLKFNPVQAVFSEIPVSLEIYRKDRFSLQIQAGYIFSSKKSPFKPLFESWGTEATASDGYLLSYRRSPFNNDGGVNIKIEFRKYKHPLNRNSYYSSSYFAPQLMYKFTQYDHQKFTIKHGTDFTFYQTESKHSSSFGLGIIFGHQYRFEKFILDNYAGFGLRLTSIKCRINEISTYFPRPGWPYYPNTLESQSRIYPFVNLGLRFGFEI